MAILKKHYDPEPIIIAERFHFYQRSQSAGESIGDHLTNLRQLASRCKFGDFLGETLRDRLICVMQSENTQKMLLTKANLTLDKALEISQGMEAAALKSKELKGSHYSSSVLAVDAPAKPCGRCGCGNHDKSACKFRNATCHKCGRAVHIAPVCRSKAAGKPPRGPTMKTSYPVLLSLPLSQTSPRYIWSDDPAEPAEESLFIV